jgi:tetratricopeptide (TPR) repeat protein
MTIGRQAEAIEYGRRSAAISPTVQGLANVGIGLTWAGDLDAAADVLLEAIDLDPAHYMPRRYLGTLEATRGNGAVALEEIRLSERLGGVDQSVNDIVDTLYTYGVAGSQDDARRLFTLLQERATEFQIGPGIWAVAYLGLRDRQQALERLTEAAENPTLDNGYISLYGIAWNYFDDPMLDEAEFVEVRSRLGFRQ